LLLFGLDTLLKASLWIFMFFLSGLIVGWPIGISFCLLIRHSEHSCRLVVSHLSEHIELADLEDVFDFR
jgi:hypothetical protein